MSSIGEKQKYNFTKSFAVAKDLRNLFSTACSEIGEAFNSSRCVIVPLGEKLVDECVPLEWANSKSSLLNEEDILNVSYELTHLSAKSLDPKVFSDNSKQLSIISCSQAFVSHVRVDGLSYSCVCLYFDSEQNNFDRELFSKALSSFGLAIERILNFNSKTVEAHKLKGDESRYQRLVESSDAIIFHANPKHVLNFISEKSIDFFGVTPENLISGSGVRWYEFIHLDDRELVIQKATEAELSGVGFDEEFRVVNHISGRIRWLLAKLVPVHDSSNLLLGWDGFGIDITQRKEAQQALDSQSKRVRALYTVSSAIRGYLDPANIASRGIAALCDATGAQSGICFLASNKTLGHSKNDKILSLIAHHGVSESCFEQIRSGEIDPKLSQYVFKHGQSVVVPDIQKDKIANKAFFKQQGLRSAMLVPIIVEEEILGVLGLFQKERIL